MAAETHTHTHTRTKKRERRVHAVRAPRGHRMVTRFKRQSVFSRRPKEPDGT